MTSPRLLIFAQRARTSGSMTQHMPISSPPFLMGPDEICLPPLRRYRPWKFKALCLAVIFLGAGISFGPQIFLYLQALIGE